MVWKLHLQLQICVVKFGAMFVVYEKFSGKVTELDGFGQSQTSNRTMVSFRPLRIRVLPLPNGLNLWLINGGGYP